jgi:hypothetical protein
MASFEASPENFTDSMVVQPDRRTIARRIGKTWGLLDIRLPLVDEFL